MATPSRARPDIIIRYPGDEDGYRASSTAVAYLVVSVRPETNRVLYEKAILSGVRRHADVIYLANLKGVLFLQDHILEEHYASQYRFATRPFVELQAHPEVAARFERHFGVRPEDARLIGSFEAVQRIGIGKEELFATIVPERDYLECWGQSFKRVAGRCVVNPNLPAIVRRYTPEANVFVLAARCRGSGPEVFSAVNQAIFQEITARPETPVVDGQKLGSLVWSEMIRRTYHISTNHLMACFDMADLVYRDPEARLDVAETPLGRWLVAAGAIDAEGLRAMKRAQLVYLQRDGAESLQYLPLAAAGMAPEGIARLTSDGWRASTG